MPKQSRQPKTVQPAYDTTRLVVRGERRSPADWDTYVAILLAHGLHKAGVDDLLGEKGSGDD